eukprot:gene3140-4046_t
MCVLNAPLGCRLTPAVPGIAQFAHLDLFQRALAFQPVAHQFAVALFDFAVGLAGDDEAAEVAVHAAAEGQAVGFDRFQQEAVQQADEIRKRNFITSWPYQTPVALQYDVGDYHACMTQAQELADVAGFAARKAASEAKGLKRGIGYSSYIEACGIAPSNIAGALGARAGLFECGEVRVHPTGSVTVFTGSHSHGQGHETTFAQVVAARLGIPVENVDIVHGTRP